MRKKMSMMNKGDEEKEKYERGRLALRRMHE